MKDKVIDTLKNNKRWCLLFICLIIFIVILENVLDAEIASFDSYIYHAIISLKTNNFTNVLKVITMFGSAEVLIGITVILFILLKNKKVGACIAFNLIIIGAINQALKLLVQRPRPEGFRLIEETGYSFPSGHSMASTAFYGLMIYLVFKNVKNKTAKTIICALFGLLIILIGMSRIYLGVHYASDVIAGFVLSIAYLVVYITMIVKLIEI